MVHTCVHLKNCTERCLWTRKPSVQRKFCFIERKGAFLEVSSVSKAKELLCVDLHQYALAQAKTTFPLTSCDHEGEGRRGMSRRCQAIACASRKTEGRLRP
eukprot:1158367-Pelagomonas_calceolata.AAC.6